MMSTHTYRVHCYHLALGGAPRPTHVPFCLGLTLDHPFQTFKLGGPRLESNLGSDADAARLGGATAKLFCSH